MPQSNLVVPLAAHTPPSNTLVQVSSEGIEKMVASTLNGTDIRITDKMLLPPTMNQFALHAHPFGAQTTDHLTDNIHLPAVSVLSFL